MKSFLNISAAAEERLGEIFAQNPGKLLRVGLNNKGCSGHSYTWELVDGRVNPDDSLLETCGGQLVIDARSELMMFGSTLELEQDQFGSQLVWKNPNVVSQCGCGKSVGF